MATYIYLHLVLQPKAGLRAEDTINNTMEKKFTVRDHMKQNHYIEPTGEENALSVNCYYARNHLILLVCEIVRHFALIFYR